MKYFVRPVDLVFDTQAEVNIHNTVINISCKLYADGKDFSILSLLDTNTGQRYEIQKTDFESEEALKEWVSGSLFDYLKENPNQVIGTIDKDVKEISRITGISERKVRTGIGINGAYYRYVANIHNGTLWG